MNAENISQVASSHKWTPHCCSKLDMKPSQSYQVPIEELRYTKSFLGCPDKRLMLIPFASGIYIYRLLKNFMVVSLCTNFVKCECTWDKLCNLTTQSTLVNHHSFYSCTPSTTCNLLNFKRTTHKDSYLFLKEGTCGCCQLMSQTILEYFITNQIYWLLTMLTMSLISH